MALGKQRVQQIEECADALCKLRDCYIYGLEYISGSNTLRVYIDKEESGIDIEDCAEVSRGLSKWLDENEVFSEPYNLEVSSPGLERILIKDWHYQEVVGKTVALKLYESLGNLTKTENALKKAKNLTGKLISFEPEALKIEVEGTAFELPLKKVAKAHLVFEME